jgi:hypothetical protein
MFMSCLIVLVARLQWRDASGDDWLWPALLCGHFAAGVAVLFARLKLALLFPLALIVNAPIIAALVQFHVSTPELWFVAAPYLGVWALFLLTRWRQTDLALGVLNEEIHYYLIDQEQDHESRNYGCNGFCRQSPGYAAGERRT